MCSVIVSMDTLVSCAIKSKNHAQTIPVKAVVNVSKRKANSIADVMLGGRVHDANDACCTFHTSRYRKECYRNRSGWA